ncbi:MAG: hypothetical protein DME25_05410, partial [Verrucomicrobia bacterium]
AIPYEKIKQPASEMTRLVHNDYLEQASDSGLIGLLTYGLFIAGALVWGYPTPKPLGQGSEETDWFAFSVWLGVLGWSLQSLLEFSLYVPALAWPAFTFLGLLLANRGRNQSVNVNVA